MNRYATMASALMIALTKGPLAYAEPPVNVQLEVNFLLGVVEGSGCAFYRNGTEYDSKMAAAHLRGKYRYLVAVDQIKTTEDFIEKAATASGISGQPYQVRCGMAVAVTSNQWLRDELKRFRILRGNPASFLWESGPVVIAFGCRRPGIHIAASQLCPG